MARSAKSELARLPVAQREAWLREQPSWVIEEIVRGEWWWTGRPEQFAPPGNWFIWLLLAGRGFGKTRTAAEWLAERVLKYPVDASGFRTEWLIIAETLTDGLRLCVRGPAGIARVLERKLGPERRSKVDASGRWKVYGGSKPFIQLWDKTGAESSVIYIEGADDEDVGRGYNASGAWLDEYAKWPKPDGSWIEGIAPSLRAELPPIVNPDGTVTRDFPRVVVATTPKLVVQLVEWQDRTDGSVVVTSGSTYDNAGNLSTPTVEELHRRYAGTRIGRQELLGELIREIQGAMWKLDWIDNHRIHPSKLPELGLTVVGMDPAGTGERDETGLICAARGMDGDDYVLGDWSKRIAGAASARRAWEMVAAYGARWLVIESNMAKRWVSDVVLQEYKLLQKAGVFPKGWPAPIKLVNARVGKELRAEPIAARYEQGRYHHVLGQGLQDLETQMISWVPMEMVKGATRLRRNDSPDRVDGLVHAGLFLASGERMEVGAVSPVAFDLPLTTMGPLAG
jgi:phage terminase large subunit-like protein